MPNEARAVHPLALRVAALGERFSLDDQQWAVSFLAYCMYGAGAVGFAIGFIYSSFSYTAGIVGVAALFCIVALVPNWRQTRDAAVTYVSDEKSMKYYDALEKCRAAVNGDTTSLKLRPVS